VASIFKTEEQTKQKKISMKQAAHSAFCVVQTCLLSSFNFNSDVPPKHQLTFMRLYNVLCQTISLYSNRCKTVKSNKINILTKNIIKKEHISRLLKLIHI
jgi:hypothetical protein